MIYNQMEAYVKERFGMNLREFIIEKIEEESLYDYEIARMLNVTPSFFGRLRSAIGIKRSNGFSRRFEKTYGRGSVETFKKLIEVPDNSLADVGSYFGFSRQNAWLVFKKIYGCSYSKTYKRKILERKLKSASGRSPKKSKIPDKFIKAKTLSFSLATGRAG